MNITGTLAEVRISYGDSTVTVDTDAGLAVLQCRRDQAVEAQDLLRRRIRVDVEWLIGGFFGLAGSVRLDRCDICGAPTGPDCEGCGAREVRRPVQAAN